MACFRPRFHPVLSQQCQPLPTATTTTATIDPSISSSCFARLVSMIVAGGLMKRNTAIPTFDLLLAAECDARITRFSLYRQLFAPQTTRAATSKMS
jgi:hypothetical protein